MVIVDNKIIETPIKDIVELLRQQFVNLYSQPILENFLESLEIRYPDLSFPKVPEKGNLDLHSILESPYFFN